METQLQARSQNKCELCGASDALAPFAVAPHTDELPENNVLLCTICRGLIDQTAEPNPHHWRGLGESMWTPVPAVQVMAWRQLNNLRHETWAMDLLESLYLDEETQAWAEQGASAPSDSVTTEVHRDSNGLELAAGDSVTLIKDLKVKGAGFTAKRGTPVRNISLVRDNPAHIEGRVEGQQIVILTEFVKKNV